MKRKIAGSQLVMRFRYLQVLQCVFRTNFELHNLILKYFLHNWNCMKFKIKRSRYLILKICTTTFFWIRSTRIKKKIWKQKSKLYFPGCTVTKKYVREVFHVLVHFERDLKIWKIIWTLKKKKMENIFHLKSCCFLIKHYLKPTLFCVNILSIL